MKIILLIIFLFTGCGKNMENNKELDYSSYLDKTINFFLIENNNYNNIIIVDEKPGLANSLLILYPNNLRIELFPLKFEKLKPFDINRKWNLSRFKEEKIRKIIVYHKDKIISIHEMK